MKNIYLLPTDKPSRLIIDTIENKLSIQDILHEKTINVLPQNIYITSDEQVKEGDYYVSLILDGKKIWKTTKIDCITKADLNKTNEYLVEPFSKYCKKLVLTTDTQLIKDGVQEIGDEFLEWFVKNPTCEEVMVDKFISERYFCTNPIIPKEEPKQETNKMEKEFVPYEQAFELAKLNFNEKCFGYYDLESEVHIEISCNLDTNLTRRNFFAAPTYQQAFRWFREKHNTHSYNIAATNSMVGSAYGVLGLSTATFNGGFKTYEEAQLACLKKLIENLKQIR